MGRKPFGCKPGGDHDRGTPPLPAIEEATFSPESLGPTEVGADDEFTYGVALGVDVPIRSGKWLFATSARLMSAGTDLEFVPDVFLSKLFRVADFDPDELSIDPLEVRVGLARRFGG